MKENIDNSNSKLGRARSATEKFVRDYSEQMKTPVAHLSAIVQRPDQKIISGEDLVCLKRILKDIHVVLDQLMDNLEKEGNT